MPPQRSARSTAEIRASRTARSSSAAPRVRSGSSRPRVMMSRFARRLSSSLPAKASTSERWFFFGSSRLQATTAGRSWRSGAMSRRWAARMRSLVSSSCGPRASGVEDLEVYARRYHGEAPVVPDVHRPAVGRVVVLLAPLGLAVRHVWPRSGPSRSARPPAAPRSCTGRPPPPDPPGPAGARRASTLRASGR
jgi:hypothetical protein